MDVLAELEAHPGFEDAVVIIQGDHGSRIMITPPMYDYYTLASTRDYLDSYSTLLAMRGPRIPSGVDSTRASIQEVISLLTQSDFAWPGPVTAAPPFVFIAGDPGEHMRREPYPVGASGRLTD
jgi:hypothetical protein